MSGLKLSDEKLVELIQTEKSDEALQILIQRHGALCINILQRYSLALTERGLNMQDVYSDKNYLIYKAALGFKSGKKNRISTWIGSYTRYYCLTLLSKKEPFLEKGLYSVYFETFKASSPDDESIDRIFNILSLIKDERINKIFRLRYSSPGKRKVSWKEIGKTLGLSSQTIINLHKRGVKLLQKRLKNEEIFDKI